MPTTIHDQVRRHHSSHRGLRTALGMVLAAVVSGLTPERTDAAGTLYWSRAGLKRASTDGDCLQRIQPHDISWIISDVDVHWEIGKVYFTRGGEIRRCDLDGGNTEVVYPGPPGTHALDIDRVNGKLYWTDGAGAGHRIMRANLDASNVEQVFNGPAPESSGIAVDSAGDKVYWIQYSFDTYSGLIHRANLDGTAHEQIVVSGQVPRGIAVHNASGKVYWTEYGDGVYRANLDFSNVEQIVTAIPYLTGIDVDEAAGKLYFGREVVPQDVFRCDLDGGGLVGLGVGAASGIACVPEEFGFVCFGDANEDLFVNVEDILSVINSWGPCRLCPADLTGDGIVNENDLLFVLNHWMD